jgi:hypothetical protein
MPTYLHQLIAVQRGVDEEVAKTLGSVRHLLAVEGDQDPKTGLSRVYDAIGDDPANNLPAQSRRVQMTAPELLGRAVTALDRLFNLKFTREEGNCEARADVIVDGTVLLGDVPVGYLMFLEAQAGKIIEMIDQIPTLNPADEWTDTAPGLREGVWASAAKKTAVSRRLPQVQVLSPAQVIDGQKFEPQVRPYETEVTVGWWTTVKYSGQMDPKVQQDMRARAVKVQDAVRKAREQANRLEVTDRQATPLLEYIFGVQA